MKKAIQESISGYLLFFMNTPIASYLPCQEMLTGNICYPTFAIVQACDRMHAHTHPCSHIIHVRKDPHVSLSNIPYSVPSSKPNLAFSHSHGMILLSLGYYDEELIKELFHTRWWILWNTVRTFCSIHSVAPFLEALDSLSFEGY